MLRDVSGRFTIVEAGHPLEPINWNATCGRRLRPRLDGALVLLLRWGHLPVPLTLSPKAGSTGRDTNLVGANSNRWELSVVLT